MEKLYSAVEEVEQYLNEGKIVKLEVLEELKEKVKSVEAFIESNPNIEALSEPEKDALFAQSKEHWNGYTDYLRDIDYHVEISGEEFHYIHDLITKDLHYNETDIFVAIKFKEQFLDVVDQLQKIDRDKKLYTIKVKINDVTLLHHLMKNESVKGLGKKAYMFRNVIALIGKIYKIFQVWNTESENISSKISNWTIGLLNETPTTQEPTAVDEKVVA